MSKLWRSSPRHNRINASLAEQFARDNGADAWDSVSPDLFFDLTADGPPNAVGAFSITCGPSPATFLSKTQAATVTALMRQDIHRVILAELSYRDQTGSGAAAAVVTRTKYFSNNAYFADDTNVRYHDCIHSTPRYRREIDRATLRGRVKVTLGDLVIDNTDGMFDDLVTLACDGSSISFYLGDGGDIARGIKPWLRSQFVFMFTAKVIKISASKRDKTVTLALSDNSVLLNRTIGANRTVSDVYQLANGVPIAIGANSPNAAKALTVNFGFTRQVQCVLVDYATQLYSAYDLSPWTNSVTASAQIIQVRDKGLAVSIVDNGDGTFRLLSSAVGAVTADVLTIVFPTGITGYPLVDTLGSYRVSDAFWAIVGVYLAGTGVQWGGASGNFDYYGLNDYHVNFSLSEARNVLDLLDEISDAGNCYYASDRSGNFVFGWIRPEASSLLLQEIAPVATLLDDHLVGNETGDAELNITHADPLYYSVQGIANVNWTQQTDFVDISPSFTAAQRQVLNRDGYRAPAYDGGATTQAYNPPVTGSGQWNGGRPENYHRTMTKLTDARTLLSCRSDVDASTELTAWNGVRRGKFLPWLEFIDTTVDLRYYYLELGNIMNTALSRYGLGNSTTQVCSIDIDLMSHTIGLGLVHRRPAVTDVYT
jgi:hypothetical protein